MNRSESEQARDTGGADQAAIGAVLNRAEKTVPVSDVGRTHVILVHGTWGHGILYSLLWDFLPPRRRPKEIDWPVGTKLAEAGATLHSFTWSGKNSHRRRREAGEHLAQFVSDLKTDGANRVWIIAHSHGGNVAFYALRYLHANDVDGIACLSTPFLHFSTQPFDFRVLRSLPFSLGVCVFIYVNIILLPIVTFHHPFKYYLPIDTLLVLAVSYLAGILAGRALRGMLSKIDLFRARVAEIGSFTQLMLV